MPYSHRTGNSSPSSVLSAMFPLSSRGRGLVDRASRDMVLPLVLRECGPVPRMSCALHTTLGLLGLLMPLFSSFGSSTSVSTKLTSMLLCNLVESVCSEHAIHAGELVCVLPALHTETRAHKEEGDE